jgi:hypothetical protein
VLLSMFHMLPWLLPFAYLQFGGQANWGWSVFIFHTLLWCTLYPYPDVLRTIHHGIISLLALPIITDTNTIMFQIEDTVPVLASFGMWYVYWSYAFYCVIDVYTKRNMSIYLNALYAAHHIVTLYLVNAAIDFGVTSGMFIVGIFSMSSVFVYARKISSTYAYIFEVCLVLFWFFVRIPFCASWAYQLHKITHYPAYVGYCMITLLMMNLLWAVQIGQGLISKLQSKPLSR